MTIRPLAAGDLHAAVDLLSEQPEFNLYTLSNLRKLGFETDYCQYWGDFGDDGTLRAVLNRYRDGWTIFGRESAAWPDLGVIVDQHPVDAKRIQDNPGGVGSFLPYLQSYRVADVHEEELMRLERASFQPADPLGSVEIRRAEERDLPRLFDFYADAGSMSRSPERVAEPLKHRRIWIALEGDEVSSAALTNGELETMAMVGGVFTRPQSRNRGLSQAVVSRLCEELLNESRTPILYWDHPAAGAVYRKLGFTHIGMWRSVFLGAGDD